MFLILYMKHKTININKKNSDKYLTNNEYNWIGMQYYHLHELSDERTEKHSVHKVF